MVNVLALMMLPLMAQEDGLARFKPFTKVGAFSSYDRTGGNDDGFSGKYSFLRKEGDGLIIAELTEGPGMLTRIWTPTPTDDPIEFWFDGEPAPRYRLKFIDLFTGKQAPFEKPLVGSGAGGYYSYVPLKFRKSIRVIVRAEKVRFHQINYALGNVDAPEMAKAVRQRHVADVTVTAAKPALLFSAKKGGRIHSLRLSPASAFAGPARDIVLRAYWDDDSTAAINVPVADLFGYSFGDPAAKSLLFGTDDGVNFMRFPMPFDRAARIEIVSERASPVSVHAEVEHSDRKRLADEGRFYAVWRRENPTQAGKPFTFVEAQGRGHVVGTTLQAQGFDPGRTPFFEGDDQTTIDGELAIHGTGSEDFFNGGWYDIPGRWYGRVSLPYSGCLDYKKHMARTGAYRIFLNDALAFQKSVHVAIEHAPEKNSIATDYTGVTFLYADRRPVPAAPLPPLAARRVTDPARLVFSPGWTEPVYASSLDKASITKKRTKLVNAEVRYLSFRAEDADRFGSHFIAFHLDIPSSGRYKVSLEGLKGPDQGIVQVAVNDQPVGEPVDLYAPRVDHSGVRAMATVEFWQGLNPLFFHLVGKNAQSSGLGFDIVRIHVEPVGR
ncbi:MAG: DUF2961 domain-containing protein [Acidobacteria bacterium]|nr:DUF2961 domain-containing protein [Acidobacteriota bacterium]